MEKRYTIPGRFLLCLSALAIVTSPVACSFAPPTRKEYTLPSNYREGMERLKANAPDIEALIAARRYDKAEQAAEMLMNEAQTIQRFMPSNAPKSIQDHNAYVAQANALHSTSYFLLEDIRHHRRLDGLQRIEEFVARYNRLSKTYGPNSTITLPERRLEEYPAPDFSKRSLPGDKMYR